MTARSMTAISVANARPNKKKRVEIPDTKCAGLYLIVQPSGAKSWAYRYRIGGKPAKLTLGAVYIATGQADEPAEAVLGQSNTLAGARELAMAASRKVALGLDPAAELKDRKSRARTASVEASLADRDRVEAVAASFLAKHVAQLRPRTREQYEHVINNMIVHEWLGRTIQTIGKRDVADLLDEIRDNRGPIAANRARAVLSKLFAWAMARDIVSASPVAAIERAPETSRERFLTDAELQLVWLAADTIGLPFGHLTKMLILTGMRLREVAQTRWSEIDVAGRIWNLPAERSKNRRAHSVPLADTAINLLQSLPRIGTAKDGFAFTTNGETAISGFSLAKGKLDAAIERLQRQGAEAAGLDPAGVAPLAPWAWHDLRRSFAAGLGRLGFSGEVIERSLNHVSGAFGGIRGVYQRHHYQDEMRVAFAAWARHVEALVSGAPAGNVVELRGAGR